MLDTRSNHYQLHRQLIIAENRPCARCGGMDNREVHRLVPRLGYTRDNAMVLCQKCHRTGEHYQGKFQPGDRIYLNGRTPGFVELRRHRPRTVKAVRYDPQKGCNYYLLGSNGMGDCEGEPATGGYASYEFRSYQLHPWAVTGKTGRPRAKRKYIYKSSEHQGIREKVEAIMNQRLEEQI